MDLRSESARSTSADDQRLQVFKAFYTGAGPAERKRLADYIRALAALSGSDMEDSARFVGEIGGTGNRILYVQVSCSFLPDGPSATIDPHLLSSAIGAWERGDEFAPPDLIG